jgi:poly-beta-1,6-N-acetyl-D-glucosamine synthase
MAFKVVLLVENNTVPTDIRVWREARTAVQAGYSVTVVAPASDRHPRRHEWIDGVEIFRHPAWQAEGSALKQMLEYANAFAWEAWICVKLALRRPPRIVHAANPPDYLFLIAWILRTRGVKFIFDHHDLSPELYLAKFGPDRRNDPIHRLLRWMERRSCRAADAVISSNRSYREHVIAKHGIAPEKVFVVRNDPEPDDTCSTSRRQDSNGLVRLIYVGAISRQDGVDILMRAIHCLVTDLRCPGVRCAVVGDGDDLDRVKRLCSELGLDAHCEFTGYVHERERVREMLDMADICLEAAPCSEVNARSTFIKVMEYMAAGRPIVAFDLEETRFSAQGAAILVPDGDVRAFAAAIRTLVEDPHMREELGARGLERICKELNWSSSAKELLRAYEYVLRAPTPGGVGRGRWAEHERVPRQIPEGKTRAVGSGRKARSYVIVSTVKDEERFVEETLRCVAKQTVLPARWIIVDDRSIDRTRELVQRFIGAYQWIELIGTDADAVASGSPIMHAFYLGLRRTAGLQFDYLVKLDCDLMLPADYFERLLEEFERDPALGIASGIYLEEAGGEWRAIAMPQYHAAGASKMVRRECFEDFGGFVRERGWDTVDEVRAQCQGWRTRHFCHLRFRHLKPEGSRAGSLRTCVMHGEVHYLSGGGPLFLALKAAHRMIAGSPVLLGGCAVLLGYLRLLFARRTMLVSVAEARYYRQVLNHRMREWIAERFRKLHALRVR